MKLQNMTKEEMLKAYLNSRDQLVYHHKQNYVTLNTLEWWTSENDVIVEIDNKPYECDIIIIEDGILTLMERDILVTARNINLTNSFSIR